MFAQVSEVCADVFAEVRLLHFTGKPFLQLCLQSLMHQLPVDLYNVGHQFVTHV